MRRFLVALGAVALLVPAAGPSFANVSNNGLARMRIEGSVNAPLGYQLFCLTNPRHCRGGGASEVSFTDQVGEVLQRVNTSVNRAIQPRSERRDVWSIGVSQGDCEDYALAKRVELIRLGIPAGALRIAMAKTGGGEGHAVLVVRTDAGDLVLDNLTSRIKNWDQTGLRWVAIASSNAKAWQQIR